MPRIHVCSMARIADVTKATGARTLVTLINRGTPVERPVSISAENHLFVAVSDITSDMDGEILPGETHVATLLDFVQRWDRVDPLLIHCYAGISRSTAAAFISACALCPDRDEDAIARNMRIASPTATPNARLVAVADTMLARSGRMVAAIERIGRGRDCFEGVPFGLELR
ncbi:MAG: tyrosine phosphatase family protein [Beijerinckiaceae bacterium]